MWISHLELLIFVLMETVNGPHQAN